MVKIVVDAFGGDYAPVEVVAGAIEAVNNNDKIVVVLSGKEEVLKEELSKYKYNEKQIEIINADEVIDNNESPTVAIRTKKNSSLVKAFDYANEHEDAVGVISAGSTGAVLTGGFMKFGRIRGIHRPALCPVFNSITGSTISICDCGANMDCKPEYLEQFAVMASAYHNILGNKKPRVALLNVGTEDHKGDTLTKEAFALLSNNKDINFVGNMEARDLLSGEYDIVVCGKQTTDGDTAQVGAELAHFLGIPYVCYVDKIIEVKDKSIVVRTNMDKTYETVEIAFPCLITVEKNNESPRLPSYKRSVQYSDHQMHIVTFDKFFDTDESKYGLKGSPTQVERMFNPIKDDRKVMLNEDEKSYAVQ